MADNSICSVDECGKSVFARSLCSMHYARVRRHGDVRSRKRVANGEARLFFETFVVQYDGDECVTWPFHRDRDGYGQLYHDGQMRCVSRLVCERENGPPPSKDHVSAHSCGQGHLGCVAKRHLRWATRLENEADKSTHGTLTFAAGEAHPNAIISDDDVASILAMAGRMSHQGIAELFGVSRSHIGNILRGARRAANR